jgi:hypothetical protein
LQNEILEEIATNSDLRLDAMKVVVDLPGDPAYDLLNAYVATKIPEDFGHLLRVCNLGDTNDYCKMDPIIFYATLDKDVFVEDVVISAEIGDGAEAEYSPKKIRLFFWEGGFPSDYCRDECMENRAPLSCSNDFSQVLRTECGEFDNTDACLEYGTTSVVVEDCLAGEFCMDEECVYTQHRQRVCKERSYVVCDACADTNWYPGLCSSYDGGFESGDCNGGDDDDYTCYNWIDSWKSECVLPASLPGCPATLSAACDNFIVYDTAESSVVPCVPPTCEPVWTPLPSTKCLGTPFDQTNQCNSTIRSAVGTGSCVASLSLGFSNINYVWNDPYHYYYHTRTFTESNGVGVTLTWGQLCSSVGCNSATINRRVDAGGTYIWQDNLYTSFASEQFTLTYTGTDDNGNPISVQRVVSVSGSSWISP